MDEENFINRMSLNKSVISIIKASTDLFRKLRWSSKHVHLNLIFESGSITIPNSNKASANNYDNYCQEFFVPSN